VKYYEGIFMKGLGIWDRRSGKARWKKLSDTYKKGLEIYGYETIGAPMNAINDAEFHCRTNVYSGVLPVELNTVQKYMHGTYNESYAHYLCLIYLLYRLEVVK